MLLSSHTLMGAHCAGEGKHGAGETRLSSNMEAMLPRWIALESVVQMQSSLLKPSPLSRVSGDPSLEVCTGQVDCLRPPQLLQVALCLSVC